MGVPPRPSGPSEGGGQGPLRGPGYFPSTVDPGLTTAMHKSTTNDSHSGYEKPALVVDVSGKSPRRLGVVGAARPLLVLQRAVT